MTEEEDEEEIEEEEMEEEVDEDDDIVTLIDEERLTRVPTIEPTLEEDDIDFIDSDQLVASIIAGLGDTIAIAVREATSSFKKDLFMIGSKLSMMQTKLEHGEYANKHVTEFTVRVDEDTSRNIANAVVTEVFTRLAVPRKVVARSGSEPTPTISAEPTADSPTSVKRKTKVLNVKQPTNGDSASIDKVPTT